MNLRSIKLKKSIQSPKIVLNNYRTFFSLYKCKDGDILFCMPVYEKYQRNALKLLGIMAPKSFVWDSNINGLELVLYQKSRTNF